MAEPAELSAEAVAIVKRAWGDNVDFSKGTTGYAFAKVVEAELQNLEELRSKMIALAATLVG